jgi:hypothetical protein
MRRSQSSQPPASVNLATSPGLPAEGATQDLRDAPHPRGTDGALIVDQRGNLAVEPFDPAQEVFDLPVLAVLARSDERCEAPLALATLDLTQSQLERPCIACTP